MEVVVTSSEMRALERHAIKHLGIPGSVLMENAGKGVVDTMEKPYGFFKGKSVVLCCGKGNNGGDGFVVARHLLNRGANVTVGVVGIIREIKGDAKANYEILKKLVTRTSAGNILNIIEIKSKAGLRKIPHSDFIIDALFGTGFSGTVRGMYKDVIEWMNLNSAIKISIDIPSGLNSDTGMTENIAVKSDLTVTMGLKKTGLLIGKSRHYFSRIEVIDIGLPKDSLKFLKAKTFIVGSEDVLQALPKRNFDAHKHSVGKIFVLAGSRGMTGAAAMTSVSAMRSGAGTVILGTPKSVYPILARKLTEVMVEPLEDTSEGSLSLASMEVIKKHITWADVVIIGPGLSRNADTQELVLEIVSKFDKPMLIDADGLNALAENVSVLKRRKSKSVILTPHTGELSRLINMKSEEIEKNRISVARETAKKFNLTLVLKGAPTVTATATGEAYINSTGNPGMATAGSGDVLSGAIAGLWAQGIERDAVAYSGVYLHGLAGDFAKIEFGEKSMMALDIQEKIPNAIKQIELGIETI